MRAVKDLKLAGDTCVKGGIPREALGNYRLALAKAGEYVETFPRSKAQLQKAAMQVRRALRELG